MDDVVLGEELGQVGLEGLERPEVIQIRDLHGLDGAIVVLGQYQDVDHTDAPRLDQGQQLVGRLAGEVLGTGRELDDDEVDGAELIEQVIGHGRIRSAVWGWWNGSTPPTSSQAHPDGVNLSGRVPGSVPRSRPRATLSSWRSMRAVAPQMVVAHDLEERERPVVAVRETPDLLVEGLGVEQVGQGHVEDLGHLARIGDEGVGTVGQQPDEGVDHRLAGEGAEAVELTDDLDGLWRQADLLVGLPQGGGHEVDVVVLLAPTGEAHLTPVVAKVGRPAGQQDRRAPVADVERSQDGRLAG